MSKKSIVYFGNEWFGENKTSSHHIASFMSESYDLVYVVCPGLRAPRASGRDIKKIIKKIINLFSNAKISPQGFPVYTMLQLPFHGYKIIRYVNELLSYYFVRKLCKKHNMEAPILWFLVPHVAYLARRFADCKIIYYCTDDHASFPGVKYDAIKKMDQYLTKNADILFVTSNGLKELKEPFAKKVIYSPHGVDFDHFNKAENYSGRLPDDIAFIEKPIIGFFGLMGDWFDKDLLKRVAEHNKDWNIVLIGQCIADYSSIERLKNIHFLGKKNYNDLPIYASTFDLTILPYTLDNYHVKYINPLKLREYLSTGAAVVSVDLPEVRCFSDIVSIAKNYNEFIASIEDILISNNNADKEARLDAVRNCSWENTGKKVIEELELLNKNNG